MAQPFDCFCGTPSCRGRIAGARDMTTEQLDGLWLNGHIRELLEERESAKKQPAKQNGTPTPPPAAVNGASNGIKSSQNGTHTDAATATADQTVLALREALSHAEKVVEAARLALVSYVETLQLAGLGGSGHNKQVSNGFDAAKPAAIQEPAGAQRRGPTSRELSGEMGGDTSVLV
jgi:hypothetical protein